MTLDEIRKAFRCYHTAGARIAFLTEQAEELRRGIEREMLPDLHAVRTQSYDGVPVAATPSSSITERTALRAVDGYKSPVVVCWQQELHQIETEIRTLQKYPRYVDIWLSALNEKERVVVTAHEIELKSWTEIELQSSKLLGNHYSESGLRRICRTAMTKICDIAK